MANQSLLKKNHGRCLGIFTGGVSVSILLARGARGEGFRYGFSDIFETIQAQQSGQMTPTLCMFGLLWMTYILLTRRKILSSLSRRVTRKSMSFQ